MTAQKPLVTEAGNTQQLQAGNQIEINAGTAALPALTIDGDPNTGIFSPGADQLAISTGGTQRVVVNASGNVGIGTTGQFQVSSAGDIVAIRGQTTTFPAANASGVLTNNGSGTLSWAAPSGITGSGTNGFLTLWNGTSTVTGSAISTNALTYTLAGSGGSNENSLEAVGVNNVKARLAVARAGTFPTLQSSFDLLRNSYSNSEGVRFYTDTGPGTWAAATLNWFFGVTNDTTPTTSGGNPSKVVVQQQGSSSQERVAFREKTPLSYTGGTSAPLQETVFNDSQSKIDFRVASDTIQYAFVVDGYTGNVGIQLTKLAGGSAHWSSTATTLNVNPSPGWTVNAFAGLTVSIVSGTGAGQSRTVVSNTADTLTVTPAWTTTPTIGSEFVVGMPSAALSVAEKFKVQTTGATSISASLALAITTISTGTTLDATHYTVLCNTAGGGFTVTLPAAATCSGRVYVVKNTSTNTATVQANGAETIDGSNTYALSAQWQSVTIQSDGSAWYRIA